VASASLIAKPRPRLAPVTTATRCIRPAPWCRRIPGELAPLGGCGADLVGRACDECGGHCEPNARSASRAAPIWWAGMPVPHLEDPGSFPPAKFDKSHGHAYATVVEVPTLRPTTIRLRLAV